jgi:hypothetical protein
VSSLADLPSKAIHAIIGGNFVYLYYYFLCAHLKGGRY